MSGLNDIMTQFHTKTKGELSKIEDLFVDMAPEPQKGKPMPPGKYRRQTQFGLLRLTTRFVGRNDQHASASGPHRH